MRAKFQMSVTTERREAFRRGLEELTKEVGLLGGGGARVGYWERIGRAYQVDSSIQEKLVRNV